MKIKNISEAPLTFPNGVRLRPGKQIYIEDSNWLEMQSNDNVKSWLAAGILLLNGVLPPPIPGDYGRIIVLADQAEYDAIAVKDPLTLYVWPEA